MKSRHIMHWNINTETIIRLLLILTRLFHAHVLIDQYTIINFEILISSAMATLEIFNVVEFRDCNHVETMMM